MGEKIIVGPITQGMQTNVPPFYVNNDSFPVLQNAYTWRARVKKRLGTSFLNRAQRYFNAASTAYTSTSSFVLVADAGNLLTNAAWTLGGSLIPSTITFTVGANDYTDDGQGKLKIGAADAGTVNYASGSITVSGGGGGTVSSATFRYYPSLPIMGLPNFNTNRGLSKLPTVLAFDTKYSYNIELASPNRIYDVSFYKNPNTDAINLPGYIKKSPSTSVIWNGQDYQLTRGANYQNAFFASNGVTAPFSTTNIGMQFKAVTNVVIDSAGPPAIITATIASHGLVVGDFLFFNEFSTSVVNGLNFQTGYVIATPTDSTVQVEFPQATLSGAGGATSTGIAQYLTNSSDRTKDCLRIYDGDPTNGSPTAPTLTGVRGWVNYCPPLSFGDYSISQLPADQYYLVGATQIIPFKDRLLFFGPVVQTSSASSQQWLKDTVIYTQNGTPYYTCSFTGDPRAANTVFYPLLTPFASAGTQNLGASAAALFEDVSGFGGFAQSGLNEVIYTAVQNLDVILLGMERSRSRLIYTGNDLLPFQFFSINSEFGDTSPLAAVQMETGVVSKGSYGYCLTTQTDSDRVDLSIPEQVFEVRGLDNGQLRVCAARDYINEWIYFSYPSNNVKSKYPTETLQYNYREQSWALFTETFTSYGTLWRSTGLLWSTVGLTFPTWNQWRQPWRAGTNTAERPIVVAGTQHGFVVMRAQGTGESATLQIENISGNTVTSTAHSLKDGDYIVINSCIGTIASEVNAKPFRVSANPNLPNTFTIDGDPTPTGTYLGGGTITKAYRPFIQTKAFPVAWAAGRKTRLGPQQYLFTRTAAGQVTVFIYLSQNYGDPYNNGPIVPDDNVINSGLVYSSKLFTSAEGTNLGLTPANVNLNLLSGIRSSQLWHRMNTSLIGDTVQVAITLSDEQMKDPNLVYQFTDVELHGMILDVSPSQLLC
jgi:hypothetical protein